MTCTHTFPLPDYDDLDLDPAEANHLLGPDDLGVKDGVWTCPHDAVEDEEKCVFHLPPSECPDDIDVTTAFLERIEEANSKNSYDDRRRHCQFIDAHFGSFEPKSTVVGGTQHSYIDCRHAQFDTVDCERTEFDQRIRFAHSTFGTAEDTDPPTDTDIRFRRAIFRYSAGFSRATFAGSVNFSGARFHDWCGLRWIECYGHADFEWAQFHDMVSARGCRFDAGASFRACKIDGWGQFLNSRFGDTVTFELAQFNDDVDFIEAEFHGTARFHEAEFDRQFNLSKADIQSSFDATAVQVDRDIILEATTIEAPVQFEDSTVDGAVQAEGVRLHDHLLFEDAKIESIVLVPNLSNSDAVGSFVSFADTTLVHGTLSQPETGTTIYEFGEATLGNVQFEGPVDGALYDYIQFYRTRFDGFDFNDNGGLDTEAVEYEIHRLGADAKTVIPADYERTFSPTDLWVTYLYAKNGADAAGDNVGAGKFFYKEMTYRRQAHWARMRTPESRPLRSRIHDFTKWGRSLLLSGVTGYGEHPDRVIYTSLAIIAGFAPFYALTVTSAAEASVWEYLALSLQSYVTFILGQPPAEFTLAGEILSALEAYIGAFLVALFVFTLTRRVNR